jgi:hypothetical protein
MRILRKQIQSWRAYGPIAKNLLCNLKLDPHPYFYI